MTAHTTEGTESLDTTIVDRLIAAVTAARTETGITAAEVAAKVTALGTIGELGATTFYNLLAGRRKALTVAELLAYSTVLGLDPLALAPELMTLAGEAHRAYVRDEVRAELIAKILDA